MGSIAVENYLKSLWQLGPDDVSTLEIAHHLNVTPASVTKMIKRLTEKGFVEQNARLSLARSDRGYILSNGKVVHTGNAEDILNDPHINEYFLGTKGD